MIDAPWHKTLFAYAMILDAERIDGLQRDIRDYGFAQKIAIGKHNPERLWSDARHARNELLIAPGRTSRDEVMVQAEKIMAVVRAYHHNNPTSGDQPT